ncbi:MAG: hypothetical protein NVS3B18_01450 [Candidatus Dormibacteria bacterium]
MARMAATQATLEVRVAVFAFDPEPGLAPARALQVLIVNRALPCASVERAESFADAALRAVAAAGLDGAGRRGRGGRAVSLRLVGIGEEAGRNRTVTPWYLTTAHYEPPNGAGQWVPAGRAPRLDARDAAALKAAHSQLRADTRYVAGAAALLGEVFTGDDLLRVHVALHGGPEGSERTFRRRVQELRDTGVLKPVRESEVLSLRQRYPRVRSPAGTGGRPPELLRYAGGGDHEQLAGLRARRSA